MGFLMRCDRIRTHDVNMIYDVSIPAGFSDALRRRQLMAYMISAYKFQSLLGFLMRCDIVESSACTFEPMFQSLLGFLMRCDSGGLIVPADLTLFQSLLGFLMRCDHTAIRRSQTISGFNPCRVF